jgi:hypothetical protein
MAHINDGLLWLDSKDLLKAVPATMRTWEPPLSGCVAEFSIRVL